MPGRAWLDLGRAALWLVAVRLGLRWLPFLRLRRWLEHGLPTPGAHAPRDPGTRCAVLAHAVDVAARNTWPWPVARCLARSLTLERLLRAEGLDARMRIGVRRREDESAPADSESEMPPGGAPTALDAHAWVECGGRVVGDQPDVATRFTVLRPAAAAQAAAAGVVERSRRRSVEWRYEVDPRRRE